MSKEQKKPLLDLDDPLANDPLESGIVPVPTVTPPMRERQITYVDDDLTEQARLASVLIESVPPRPDELRARLQPLDRIPEVAKCMNELGEDLREPKTAFVLGFIDGVLPLETIIEVTGLPERETLRILDALIAQGAVVFPKPR
jgi:hypothetical protein